MLIFDEKFFEGEERDGFYVESDMKHVWASQMEILMEIERICEKYNIRYFADSGTLLGAVRHNGFIPWDDDMDIAMLRDDYMKFICVASRELEKPLVCNNIYEMDDWTQPFARVTNGGGVRLDPEFLQRFHNCPYGAGVDIFVLDNLPVTEDEYTIIQDLFGWLVHVRNEWEKKEERRKKEKKDKGIEEGSKVEIEAEKTEREQREDEKMEALLDEVEEYCQIKLDRSKNIPNQILRVIDGLFALYGNDESTKVMNMSFSSETKYQWAGKEKSWYRESIRLPFENITVPVPIDFYKVLEKSYGADFLTPVKNWHYHDYPYYKDARKQFNEWKKNVRYVQGKMNRLEELLKEVEEG